MKLVGNLINKTKNINGVVSPKAGSGGKVQDVVYDNESIVNDEGIAIIPPYPTIPTIKVKDVLYNNESVVDSLGNAIIPSIRSGNKISYGTMLPDINGVNGDVYYLLSSNNKLLATYLYIDKWVLVDGSNMILDNVLNVIQRNYSNGSSTFTAERDGYVLCINQNINSEASTINLSSNIETDAILISENTLNENYNAPNRNHSTKIAIYSVSSGQTITFNNTIQGNYTNQIHLAFYINDEYTITREEFKAQSDNALGTSLIKQLSNGLYLVFSFECSGAGSTNNTTNILFDNGEYKIDNIFNNSLYAFTVGLIKCDNVNVSFSWGNTSNYVTRGYSIYKLMEV